MRTTIPNSKKYNYKAFVKKAFSFIVRANEQGYTMKRFRYEIKAYVSEYYGLNVREKNHIYESVIDAYRATYWKRRKESWEKELSRTKHFDAILREARLAKNAYENRSRKNLVRATIKLPQFIFFVCSKHNNPAEDHRDYQGKIYVDKFWRTKVDGSMYRAISSYIRNHQTLTVQDIMNGPVYMVTRPNCKHFFVPVKTNDVLHSSQKKVVDSTGVYYPTQYTREEYVELHRAVLKKIETIHPNEHFEKQIKKTT